MEIIGTVRGMVKNLNQLDFKLLRIIPGPWMGLMDLLEAASIVLKSLADLAMT